MKKLSFTLGGFTLLVAGSAMAAGTNLAWNDCIPGGGMADRSVACTNAGSGTVFISFVPASNFPQLAVTETYIDVVPPTPITASSWWYATSVSTRWSAGSAEPASGTCPAWWSGSAHGPLMGVVRRDIVNEAAALRITLWALIAAGEEQVAAAGTEYFSGALVLKYNAGTFQNPECLAGAVISVSDLVALQPGIQDHHFGQTAEVSNRVTFQNAQPNPDVTPTQKYTWGSIKALYR